MSGFDSLVRLFRDRGTEHYGEAVTVAEHSLLTAAALRVESAADQLVAAGLLHDVGHLLGEADDEFGLHTHDRVGGEWVAARFTVAVADPVRLHVAAKRYLCGRDISYHQELSPASRHSLAVQGGPMTPEQMAEFRQEPHSADAVLLRTVEDRLGKRADLRVPDVEEFRGLLERLETR